MPPSDGMHMRISPSSARTEWQRQKDTENANNPAIDDIMAMTGLEAVKSQVLRIKAKVETSTRQGTDLKGERLGLVLLGNPGTGKTTIARHYARILSSLRVLPGSGFVETTGSSLAHGGIAEVKQHLESLEDEGGGVYFIDEAYQLAEGHNFGGKAVLDFVLAEIENLTGKVVFVFAGYRKQMEKFYEHNPGLKSRLPYTLHFEDYTDAELLYMLQQQIVRHYKGTMRIDQGMDGLYMRIAVRRLGRGRGRDGFGNARALENLFAKIRERQSDRVTRFRRLGVTAGVDFYITKEDLIGPEPSAALLDCDAWKALQTLTGLTSVKRSVSFMIDLLKTNYKRELQEKQIIEVSLNRVFLGSPGTGKTTVAKLYGRILSDIGLLSNGEVVVKSPADFIGDAIGKSEANTKAILANSVGKVLIIDEAYMLYSGSGRADSHGTDSYKTAVIDTIVAEIQGVPGEDRCVLLLGYEDQMLEMFQNANPGLTRRFQLSEAFRFEDFNDKELEEILRLQLNIQGLGATGEAVSVAIDTLARARNGLHFGNAGDVENLVSKAKVNFQSRQADRLPEDRSIDFVFEPQDFDPDFARSSGAQANIQELFKDVSGCADIVSMLERYVKAAHGMKANNIDPRDQIPMNFIFKGPPGTGKTTTARKFGKVFFDLGFLSYTDVIECSATDLIGQYTGSTGPKTNKQLERGLGKVLFIDEAYRLGEGHFAQEALNELVDAITKPRFARKMVIILAGYDQAMNNLLSVNEGLSSRFAGEVIFPALSPEQCVEMLTNQRQKSKIFCNFDFAERQMALGLIKELSMLPGWGNARDVQTLAKSMVLAVYQDIRGSSPLHYLLGADAVTCIQTLLSERQCRNRVTPRLHRTPIAEQSMPQDLTQTATAPRVTASATTSPEHRMARNEQEPPRYLAQDPATTAPLAHSPNIRDDGVSDAVRFQLRMDKRAAEEVAKHLKKELHDAKEACRDAREAEMGRIAEAAALQEIQARTALEASQLLKEQEEARIQESKAKALKELLEEQLAEKERQRQQHKQEKKQAMERLKEMGLCPAGFHWTKEAGGYRCSAGAHFVPDSQLEK